eukprot:m.344934 g.344934  ORF g.344934 m.344934 type:complete len:1152 (-) comp25430_c0_seq1:163-3618(-)
MEQLQERIRILQQERQHDLYLADTVRSMEKSYNVVKAQAMELEGTMPSMRTQLETLQQSLTEKDKLTHQLRDELADRDRKLAENADLQNRLDSTISELKAVLESVDKLTAQKEEITKKLTVSQKEKQEAINEVENLKSQIKKFEEDTVTLKSDSERQCTALMEELKKVQDELRSARREYELEKSDATEQIASLSQELQQEKEAKQDSDEKFKESLQEISGAKDIIVKEIFQGANSSLSSSDNMASHSQNTSLSLLVPKLAKHVVSLEENLEALKSKNTSTQDEVQAAQNKIKEKDTQLTNLKTESERKLEAYKEELQSLLNKCSENIKRGFNETLSDGCVHTDKCSLRPRIISSIEAQPNQEWMSQVLKDLAKTTVNLPICEKELAESEAKLTEVTQRLTQRDEQLDNIRSQMMHIAGSNDATSSKTPELSNTDDIKTHLDKIAFMHQEAIEAGAKITSLQTLNDVQAKELENYIKEIGELKVAHGVIQGKSEAQENEIIELKKTLQDRDSKSQTDGQRKETTDQQQKKIDNKPSLTDTDDTRITKLEDELWERKSKIKDLEGTISMLNSRISMRQTSAKINTEAMIGETEANHLRDLLSQKEASYTQLQACVSSKEQELATISEKLKTSTDEIELLKNELQGIKAKNPSKTSDKPDYKTERQSLQEQLQEKEVECKRLEAALSDSQASANNDLKEQIHVLEAAKADAIANANKINEMHVKYRQSSSTEVAVLKSQLRNQDKRIKDLVESQDSLAVAVSQSEALSKENAELQKEVASLTRQLEEGQEEITRLKQEVKTAAEEAVKERRTQEDNAMQEVTRLNGELDTCRVQLSELQEEKQRLLSSIKESTSELTKSQNQLQEVTANLKDSDDYHLKRREYVMNSYDRLLKALATQLKINVDLDQDIINNPIDRKADPGPVWDAHCEDIDETILRGLKGLTERIDAFPQELQNAKKEGEKETERVRSLLSDQVERLKTKIQRSQQTMATYDEDLRELNSCRKQLGDAKSRLQKADTDATWMKDKLEQQRKELVSTRDQLEDQKRLAERLAHQVASRPTRRLKSEPTDNNKTLTSTSESVHQDRSKAAKLQEALAGARQEQKEYRSKTTKLISTLRKECAEFKLSASQHEAKADALQHQLQVAQKELEETKKG